MASRQEVDGSVSVKRNGAEERREMPNGAAQRRELPNGARFRTAQNSEGRGIPNCAPNGEKPESLNGV